jgi:hypothetical protein
MVGICHRDGVLVLAGAWATLLVGTVSASVAQVFSEPLSEEM